MSSLINTASEETPTENTEIYQEQTSSPEENIQEQTIDTPKDSEIEIGQINNSRTSDTS